MGSLHILHLIDSLNIGGTEGKLVDLIAGLIERGYRISVGYCTQGPWADKLKDMGVEVTRLPYRGRVDPALLFRTIKLIRSDFPYIVHTHLVKSDLHGRLAARLANVPIVIGGLHNSDPWARHRMLGLIYGATARFTDCLIAVSEQVRQYHISHTNVSPDKIVTIENGVDVGRFKFQEEKGRATRAKLGIDLDAILFGTVGRLKPQKDHSTFLQAAKDILGRYPSARFLIVGDGPSKSELEMQARQLDLLPALIFTGTRTDIPNLLSALDVFVLSSRWEGLPNVVLEAMASTRPVVATAVDGVEGVIASGKNGLLVSPGDPTALAGACQKLASDPDMRNRLGQAGHKYVVEHHSLAVMIDKYATCYAYLLRKHGFSLPNNSQSKLEIS